MRLYFCRKYVADCLIITVFIFFAASMGGMDNALLKSALYAGLIGGLVTDRFFSRKNLWVLYYNLRISRPRLIAVNILVYELIAVFSIKILQSRI